MHSSDRAHKQNILTPIAILIVGVLISGAIYLNRTSVPTQKITVPQAKQSRTEAFVPINADKDHILGDPTKAKVTIVDYSDLECPYCKDLHETFFKIYKEHENTGEVAWVYRHFPLSIHTKSIKEAEAAECVAEIGGNEAFWDYTHTIFSNTPSNDGLDPSKLTTFAVAQKIDKTKFEECLSSGKYTEKIKNSYEDAMKLIGEESTPYTVLIVDNKIVPLVDQDGIPFGALPYVSMNALIKEFLKSPKTQ